MTILLMSITAALQSDLLLNALATAVLLQVNLTWITQSESVGRVHAQAQ